ncbi:hypothetical protein Aduo_004138 [Ancylostoma duodenale]
MRKMAKEIGVSERSVRRICHKSLGMKSYKRQKCHSLTPAIISKREQRCRNLLCRFSQARCRAIVFSDEKLFTVEAALNHQNDRFIARSIKEANGNGSPDLNPLDYAVWGFLEARACSTPHMSLASLREALEKAWEEIDDNYLRAVVDAFHHRLKACVAAKGGIFEI